MLFKLCRPRVLRYEAYTWCDIMWGRIHLVYNRDGASIHTSKYVSTPAKLWCPFFLVRTIQCYFLVSSLICRSLEPVDPVKDVGPLATRHLDWQNFSFLSWMRVTRSATDTYDPVLHSKSKWLIIIAVRCLRPIARYIIMAHSVPQCFFSIWYLSDAKCDVLCWNKYTALLVESSLSGDVFCKCNGIAFENLGKAGNYLDTGNGIVLVLLGRRILDGKPGVSAPAQSSIVRR